MDMSAKQKCFDLGGACKVKENFCIKCALPFSDLMFHWGERSEFRCGAEWCVWKCCYHRTVGDDDELDMKKIQLRALLGLEKDGILEGVDHVEEQNRK